MEERSAGGESEVICNGSKTTMQTIVDADACPRVIKEFLYRTSECHKVAMTTVANTPIRTKPLPHIRNVVVPEGVEEADDKIVALIQEVDLIITADIPLAYRVVQKKGIALDTRGQLYDESTVAQRLTIRDPMDELHESGMQTGGPASFSNRDKQAFANEFEALMGRIKKQPVL